MRHPTITENIFKEPEIHGLLDSERFVSHIFLSEILDDFGVPTGFG